MTLESDVNLTSNGRQMSAGSNIEKKRKKESKRNTRNEWSDFYPKWSFINLHTTHGQKYEKHKV